jgi:TIR domain/Pentapeptide repeats (8 copies)
MANEEHLRILKRGTDDWNKWRAENSEIEPDLSGVNLAGGNFDGANFMEVNFNRANFNRASLVEANFALANLTQADLNCANLNNADLYDADLSNADLDSTNLNGASFVWANLSRAILTHAELMDTNFARANLDQANFSQAEMGWTIFANNDLSVVLGLDTVRHGWPSFISIDTIYISKGNIPEVFLRGAGVPDNFIDYMTSLTTKALEFYSCFISFTESDDAFSERLYNDLQAAGVRCWRWKEDAKWGKTLMRSIDEAVRVYDKLVVICSEQSLNSPAVIREIERALQKEDELARQGKEGEVLFPIRLDDYIFSGWSHHRKADVTAKHIGDFRIWKEPETYRKRLDRLVKNLKADGDAA